MNPVLALVYAFDRLYGLRKPAILDVQFAPDSGGLAATHARAVTRAAEAAAATGRRHFVRQERFGTFRLWRWGEIA